MRIHRSLGYHILEKRQVTKKGDDRAASRGEPVTTNGEAANTKTEIPRPIALPEKGQKVRSLEERRGGEEVLGAGNMGRAARARVV